MDDNTLEALAHIFKIDTSKLHEPPHELPPIDTGDIMERISDIIHNDFMN